MRLVAVVFAAMLAVTGCGSDEDTGTAADTKDEASPFGEGSYKEAVAAIEAAGLSVCDEDRGEGNVSGSYESRSYNVQVGECEYDSTGGGDLNDALVTVQAYGSPGELDSAVTQHAEQGFGDGLVGYQWQQYLVAVHQGAAPEAVTAFREGMSDLGAGIAYDRTGES